ncbi:MAG: hypothetical protein FJ271_09315 [Planctomycetes bacterium]|nr:hypothetical protein [Planctomycetota bacterium]
MADATAKKLVGLLQSDQGAHVRAAAALVLAEIGQRDAGVAEELCTRLDDADGAVRQQAIRSIGKLKIEQALPRLLERVQAGGEESEAAAHAVAGLGAKGTRALQGLMDKVAPGLRRRIAGALAAAGTSSAENAAVDALLDTDPGVVEAATRSLINGIPELTPAHRRSLADHLLGLLKDHKKGLALASEAAVVRLLAALGENRATSILWDRTMPPHPPEMRAAALQALGKWPEPPSKDHLKKLLACAVDGDFRIAAPALMMLKGLPPGKQAHAEWLALLDAAEVTVRQFAIDKLGERDTAEIAAALLKQLEHPDQMLRDAALGRLARLKHGRQGLAKALLDADTPDKCWLLAKALGSFLKEFPAAWMEALFTPACKWLEAGDRRGEALFYLLREGNAKDLPDRLGKRALELRKKKKYAEAVNYLRMLARDPSSSPPLRMELAGCGLKLSRHDLNPEARNADPALQQLGRLLHGYEAEILDFFKKAKWLDPEDLYYVGFHFADRDGQGRKFGGEVLKLLVQRSPRSKLAQDAKRKIRSAGL